MVKKNMDETNKGFMKHLGGLNLKKIDDTKYEFSVKIKEMHLNTGKIAHGGFLSASMLDDELKGTVKILKKTKTLVFINCEISNDKGIVVSSSGTWKIL